MVLRWAVVFCVAATLTARAQDDLVNERPPADRAALERHWGVDCAGAVSRLRAALKATRPSPGAARLDSLRQEIETCALLDRRERTADKHYILTLDLLNAWRAASDEAARQAVLSRLECQLDRHFDLHQGPENGGGL